ncbi:MAG: hypothetical protein KJ645_02165, partial [Planctomycetes bacterium]|nr:hypothetical protein [Planctomycetota bacterium]
QIRIVVHASTIVTKRARNEPKNANPAPGPIYADADVQKTALIHPTRKMSFPYLNVLSIIYLARFYMRESLVRPQSDSIKRGNTEMPAERKVL